MNEHILFKADDFGISLGVNQAIEKAYHQGFLRATSLMVNQKYAADAIQRAQNMPDLKIGLHVNLTNEFCAAPADKIPLLAEQNGRFKNGFVKLLWLAIFKHQQLKQQVRTEVEAQINKAQKMGIMPAYIDSHRHIHMIPGIFDVFIELKEKYHINDIRIINENALMTVLGNKNKGYLFDGGLIKYYLLRFFSFLNGYNSKTYFYTMLYTCKLSADKFTDVRIPRGYSQVEIMIHPGMPEVDKAHPEDIFDESILSPWRTAELETLLNNKILDNFHFDARYPWLIELYKKVEGFWFKVGQKLRFLLVGGFNTVFAYAVFAFLFALLGLPYLWALTIQYFITVNVSILTMRYYVFRSQGNFLKEYGKAWTVYIGMWLFNSAGLTVLIEWCGINELKAQALYITIATIMTYLLHKYFSFHKKLNKFKEF